MIFLRKYFIYLTFLLALLGLTGCKDNDFIIYSAEDLHGSPIAILGHPASDEELEEIFPDSDIKHFKSSSEFLLALSIGKCDAGIAEKEEGYYLLDRNPDYEALDFAYADSCSAVLIVHKSLLPGSLESIHEDGFIDSSISRIHRSILSDGYWKLILKGFGTTFSMFILGIIFAFVLAVLMLGMNSHRYLKYISGPISYFIGTIHNVPSIVLIFFFYYVVFASAHVSGILVCAIALGVYTSGSLISVFKVHLNQVDKNQHAAAQMLGLHGWKKYRYVILPQAVKPMLPLIAAESKVLLRATTYAGYISEVDLVKVTEIIRNQTYDVLVPLLLVSAIFLILSHLIVDALSAIYNKAFRYD
ncbi:MAG: ABC transporter permease subunit [Bacteroidales bacterium]|nr:ABC transporter permease subunit [Bacteroidales bacterium]